MDKVENGFSRNRRVYMHMIKDLDMKSKDYRFKEYFRLAVAKKIQSYRSEGATYQEIADKLNNDDTETFSGIGKWHAQSVCNALNKLKK